MEEDGGDSYLNELIGIEKALFRLSFLKPCIQGTQPQIS